MINEIQIVVKNEDIFDILDDHFYERIDSETAHNFMGKRNNYNNYELSQI
jgi:hypothetical protein